MNKTVRLILLGLLLLLVIIQLIPIDKSVPEVDAAQDFLTIHQPTAEIATLMKEACYDCHSYETKYPWYAKVAPVKFILQDHINEGREHLNFSVWGTYETDRADHKLEECVEEVEEGEMPMQAYANMHAEADLSPEQREMLTTWFSSVRKRGTEPARQTPSADDHSHEEDEHAGHDHD